MRTLTAIGTFAYLAPSGETGAAPQPMVEGKNEQVSDVTEFQRDQQQGQAPKAETPANREAIGGNKPPVETPYVPRARSSDDLKREAAETAGMMLEHDAKGETTIIAGFTRTIADMLYLGLPNLGTNREELGVKSGLTGAEGEGNAAKVFFNPEQAEPNLYDQLRKQAQRKDAWFPNDLLETSTFKNYLGPACRKACLLAFGYAEIGLVPAKARGPALYQADGIRLEDMPNYDPKEYVQAIMVPDNVIRPIAYVVQILKDQTTKRIAGAERPNDDKTLKYLSNEIANALYAMKFEHTGEAGVVRDDHGYLLKLKPVERGAQTPEGQQQPTSPAATGETAKPGAEIMPAYQRLHDIFSSKPALEAGQSPEMGALKGIWEVVSKENTSVNEEVLRIIGCLARDTVYRIQNAYNVEGAGDPPANLVKIWADVHSVLHGHIQYVDKDGNVVLFRPGEGKKAPVKHIKVKDKEEKPEDFGKATEAPKAANGNGKPEEQKQEQPVTA